MEYKAFQEFNNNPVSKMFRTDKIYLEKGNIDNAEYRKTMVIKPDLILEIKYNWTHQMNLSMSVQKNSPFEYDLEPMGITDYQTAAGNLHDIMELHPGCISPQEEATLLEKWATYFKGLENAFFLHTSKGQYFPAECEMCEVCKDNASKLLIMEFEFSYFPAVPQSRLGKESLSLIHYNMCPNCGLLSGCEVSGEFQSFAYDALEMIEDILVGDPFHYADDKPLKEATKFIRAKIQS